MIAFACRCGQDLEADDEMAGGRVKCPKCGSPRVVPIAEPADEPADESGARLSVTWVALRVLLGLVAVAAGWRLVAALAAPEAASEMAAGAASAVCLTVALAGLACSTRQFRG